MFTDWWLLLLLVVVVLLLLLLLLGADITDACKARVAAGDSAGGDIVAVASSLVAEMRQRVFEATKLTASAGAGLSTCVRAGTWTATLALHLRFMQLLVVVWGRLGWLGHCDPLS